VHDGELVFSQLVQGDVFGEMALLDPDVRSASITAQVDTTLLRLDQPSLYELMSNHVEVARVIIHVLCQRLRDSTQDLIRDALQRRELERELEIGRQIQAGFLPSTLPQLPRWEIAARFQAAREVAGDFYDVFTLPQDQRISLVIGDVCDKGVGAALFMTLFRSLIRATSTSNCFTNRIDLSPASPDSPEDWTQAPLDSSVALKSSLKLTNNYIARNHGQTSMFATLFFALLDPVSGTLTYINGGHEAPIVFGPSGIKTTLHPTGPAVGLFPGVDFGTRQIVLEPGDTMLAYTDGITEALNAKRELFTQERLWAIVEQTSMTAKAILAEIEASLAAHTAGALQSDDITMLAVSRLSA